MSLEIRPVQSTCLKGGRQVKYTHTHTAQRLLCTNCTQTDKFVCRLMSGDKLNTAHGKRAVTICPLTLNAGNVLNNNFINTQAGSSNVKGIVHPNFTHILLTTVSVEALVAFSIPPNPAGVP